MAFDEVACDVFVRALPVPTRMGLHPDHASTIGGLGLSAVVSFLHFFVQD